LAQGVLDVPSTAFSAGQQPPADDAMTGRTWDSSVGTLCGVVAPADDVVSSPEPSSATAAI
jgi:hypothetical protein